MNFRLPLLATTALLPTCVIATAADLGGYEPTAPVAPKAASGVDLIFEIGAGGKISPEYEGSNQYSVSPSPIVGFGYLNIPGLFEIGSTGPDEGGFSIGPSFNITGERKAKDFDAIKGLGDVDATYEAGIKVGYDGIMPKSTARRAMLSVGPKALSARSAPMPSIARRPRSS